MKKQLIINGCILHVSMGYAACHFKPKSLKWLTLVAILFFFGWDIHAQTFRAVSNEPCPSGSAARNNRVRLDDCNYFSGLGASATFCHSLTYASNEVRVVGYFDSYNLGGEFIARSLIPITMQYFYFIQDTTWTVNPNPINGIPSPSDTILNAMTCDFSGNIFAAGRGISTYRPSTGVLTYLGDLPPGLQSAGGITHRNGRSSSAP